MAGSFGPGCQQSPRPACSLDEGREIPRDVFPLPSVMPRHMSHFGGVSRKVVRRAQKQFHVEAAMEECVVALNALYSGGKLVPAPIGAPSLAQRTVLDHVRNSVLQLGGPQGLTCAGALGQLRAFDGYGEDQAPCSVRPYVPSLLSLPEKGNQAQPLDSLMGDGGGDIVGEFCRSRLLSVDEARRNLDRLGLSSVYADPRLRDPRVFSGFVRRLYEADLIEFSEEKPCEYVEMFFVAKKDGRLRMVVDCRRSNEWFAAPDKTRLCTAEALSRIELEPGSQLHISTADLKDAFYHFELPCQLRSYFGMRPVWAGDVGVSDLRGVKVSPRCRVYPRLKVLPMGWSHALWWCQAIHQRFVMRAGASADNLLEDKACAPSGRCMHLEYVDNFVVLGTCREEVNRLSASGVSALRESGLVVHEEESSEGSIKVLGWQFDGSTMRPLPHRTWRVRLALQGLLNIGRITGRQLEKVIGHATFISLGRRESLCVFGETYTFIRRHYDVPHKIWRSVRRELSIYIGICPLIWRNLALPWSSTVTAVDASTWGLGAVASEFQPKEVQHLGKFSERWRFDTEQFSKPRASTFAADVALGSEDVAAVQWAASDEPSSNQAPLQVCEGKKIDDIFQPVPFSSVDRSWNMVGRYRWKRQEPIPVLEGRASLFAVKHALRNHRNFHKRHLILSDSISSICSLDRGRGRSFGMRRVSQQVGALVLCTGTTFSFRWIPSEWNPSDGPSRGSKFPSRPTRVVGHGDPQTDFSGTAEEHNNKQKGESEQINPNAAAAPLGLPEGQESRKESYPGTDRDLSGRFSGCSMSQKVLGVLGKNPIRDKLGKTAECSESGPVFERNDQHHVHRGRGHQPSSIHDGSSSFPSTASPFSQTDVTSEVKAVHARLEESGSAKIPPSTSMGGGVCNGGLVLQSQPTTSRADDADVFLTILEARGGSFPAGSRPDSSNPGVENRLPMECVASSCGGRETFQDQGIRRDAHLRRAGDSVHSRDSVSGDAPKPQEQPGKDFRHQPAEVQRHHAHCLREDGSHGFGGSPSVSTPSWGRNKRFCVKDSSLDRGAEAWKMEKLCKCETVRERGPSRSAPRPAPKTSSINRNSGGKQHRNNMPKPALSPGRALTCAVFIEIFSGCGRLASSVAKTTGWFCLLWDIELGPEYDLRSPAKRRMLAGWVKSGFVKGFHLGTPCESFSRARDVPPGPPPLRSDLRPLGLDGLKPHDQAKVLLGNLFVRFSVYLLSLAHRLHIPASMENPQRSRIWLCPPVLALMRRKHVAMFLTHFCGWGKPFRKATSFMGVWVDFSRIEAHQCRGGKRGLCLFTGKPHQQLVGQNSSGQWLTKLAQPYPLGLCDSLAKCFYDFEVQTIASQFARHI